MRNNKIYNVIIITRNGEVKEVKEINSNNSLYCWKKLTRYLGNKYLEVYIYINGKERSINDLRKACIINGYKVETGRKPVATGMASGV